MLLGGGGERMSAVTEDRGSVSKGVDNGGGGGGGGGGAEAPPPPDKLCTNKGFSSHG